MLVVLNFVTQILHTLMWYMGLKFSWVFNFVTEIVPRKLVAVVYARCSLESPPPRLPLLSLVLACQRLCLSPPILLSAPWSVLPAGACAQASYPAISPTALLPGYLYLRQSLPTLRLVRLSSSPWSVSPATPALTRPAYSDVIVIVSNLWFLLW